MDNPYVKPPPLKEGDKVGIFVPASPVREPYRDGGLKKIEELGYVPVEVNDILAKISADDFLARKPEESFDDIQHFFIEKDIKALWAARGGYGSNHLLPLLHRLEIPFPKIVIGFSDASYLLWYLMDRFKMVVFYGPMVYSSLAGDRFDAANLKKILGGNYEEIKLAGEILEPGSARGIITGGCLSNFVSLIGTPYLPIVDRRILLLEDVGERPYRLDRMFWQVSRAGIFAKIGGLLLGQFPGCFKNKKEKEIFLQRVRGYVKEYNIPVIYDLPFGHCNNMHTLPLGIKVNIASGAGRGLF